MRKAFFFATVLGLMLVTACKKTDTGNNSGGSAGGTWTFKSINYQAPSCDTAAEAFTATIAGQGGELGVDFYNTVTTPAGTYVVIKGNQTITTANQVEVGVTDAKGNYYISTGNGNSTVSATVSNGKVSITGSGIELVNLNNPSDSASLSFTINQTD